MSEIRALNKPWGGSGACRKGSPSCLVASTSTSTKFEAPGQAAVQGGLGGGTTQSVAVTRTLVGQRSGPSQLNIAPPGELIHVASALPGARSRQVPARAEGQMIAAFFVAIADPVRTAPQ